MTKANTQLIVALDFDSINDIKTLVENIGDTVNYYKVGKQLFTQEGRKVLDYLKEQSKSIFLDLKFHDIPNTVAQAVRSGVELGADMINVHGFGGSDMLKAAVEAAKSTNPDALLIAVTVLTSMDQKALNEIGLDVSPVEQVIRLAKLAQSAGADGVVASAKESLAIREACGSNFVHVLPGIRPAGSDTQDQKRVVTPRDAALMGAEYIVVGRPITKANDPVQAANDIQNSLII